MSGCTISERQTKILEYLADFTSDNGHPPTYDEIMSQCGLASKSVVRHHLDKLTQKGYIVRKQYTARGIRLLDQAKGLLGLVSDGCRPLSSSAGFQ